MGQQWFIKHNGRVVGPASPQQLKRLAAQSKITPTTQIRLGDDGRWTSASRIKGLIPSASHAAVKAVNSVAAASPSNHVDAEVIEPKHTWRAAGYFVSFAVVFAALLTLVLLSLRDSESISAQSNRDQTQVAESAEPDRKSQVATSQIGPKREVVPTASRPIAATPKNSEPPTAPPESFAKINLASAVSQPASDSQKEPDYSKETFRRWHATSGSVIEARLVGFENGTVRLVNHSGKPGKVPFMKLSMDDQKHVMTASGWGRVWSNKGKKLVADFVSATNNEITLQLVDGSSATYSLSDFEAVDRRYIEARRKTAADSAASTITGRVVGVYDGDTLTVLAESNRQIKVRIDGIDAPEVGQAFGTKAKQALSKLCFGKIVSVESSGQDKYGRTLATVHCGGVENANAAHELLRDGLAWHYKKYSDDEEMSRLEDNARRRRVGIWSEANVVPPWDWRRWGSAERRNWLAKQNPPAPPTVRRSPSRTVTKVVAKTHWLNTKSGARHNRGCRWFGNTTNGRPCSSGEGHACGICGG